MAGPTIDHMVSVTVLIAALVLSFAVYNQIIANVIEYKRHRQVAMKAMDLMDTICLSPGSPPDWGQSDSNPLSFGLQDPESAGYRLSPYSIMRLMPSGDGGLVYYPKTDSYYSNFSLGPGGSLLVSTANCINYTTAARLLGVDGSYGFQLTITPTVSVSVTRVNLNPLRFKVEVRGPGLALGGATLNYYLYNTVPSGSEVPSIQVLSGTNQTDPGGLAFLEFPSVNGTVYAYSIIVYAHLGGLYGVGYDSYETVEENLLVPLVENFEEEIVVLAHLWDITNGSKGRTAALHYNATFLILTEDFELQPVQILTRGPPVINYGTGKPYAEAQMPSVPGILLVSYERGDEEEYGMVMMPWGISSLGISVTFGDEPSGREWVATELRQVIVNEMSYQVKLAVWSLED